MKVAFFGTSNRSIPILDALKNNFELVLCVTKEDVLVGRHQEKKETEVKNWSGKNNVNVLQLSSLKNENLEKLLEKLKELQVECGIVADFSFIIPYRVIEYFKGKLINIHFSLLPKYRGASPVQFAILNGEKATGITFHLVDVGLDTGAILRPYEYNIPANISSGDFYHLLFKFAAEKLPEVLNDYSQGKITPLLQDNDKATTTLSLSHPKSTFIYKEDAQVNWSKKPQIINRETHAYNPWPVSWSTLKDLNGYELATGKVSLRPQTDQNLKIKVYDTEVINGKLAIKEIQVEGKKKTDFESFKNGYLAATAA